MQTTSLENNTTALSASTIANGVPSRSIITVGICVEVVNTVAVGVLLVTLRWTKGGAAKSFTFPLSISLLAAAVSPQLSATLVRDISTDITVETAFVGVVGTPTYNVYTLASDSPSI